jgi:peptidoglycan hydrolase-like protein with peptidoglycan-binding domain
MKLRQLVIAAFTVSSAVAFAHGTASKTMSDNAGANVSQIQQALNDKGFDAGPVDGKAGPKTKSALKQFQQAQGISASGRLDGPTLVALGVTASTQGSSDTQSGASQSITPQSSTSPSSTPSDQASNTQQSSSAPSQSSNSKY